MENGVIDEYIVVGKGYRLARFSIYCRRGCIPIDSFPQHTVVPAAVFGIPSMKAMVTLQWLSMVSLYLAHYVCIAIDKGNRQTPHTIYGGRKWPSIDTAVHNLLWWTLVYRLTAVPPVYGHTMCNIKNQSKNYLRCATATSSTAVLPGM